MTATDDLGDFTIEIADQVESFCVAVREIAAAEDPDYAIVRYRYRWRVNGKLVRRVTSAALSDVLRHGRGKPGQRVSCTATPSDGKLLGPSASSRVTVR